MTSNPRTAEPVTTDDWYRLTDGRFAFCHSAARGLGPVSGDPLEDWECVHWAPDGIYNVGWPAKAAFARELGIETETLTLDLARKAYRQIAERKRGAQWLAAQGL